MNDTSYAPLWCKSNYSFLEGASHPEELIEEAQTLGLQHLALTDRDGVYGAVRAHVAARNTDVHLVLGSELTMEDNSTVVVLAESREGWRQLCQLISKGRLRCEKGRSILHWRELCEHASGLIALWGGRRSLLVAEADPLFVAHQLREAFGERLFALVARHHEAIELQGERRLRERARRYALPTVAGHEVLYHHPSRRDLQDTLTCIRHGCTLGRAGTRTHPNAQHGLLSPLRMRMLFHDDLTAVARSHDIARRCQFSLADIRYRYPAERLPDGRTTTEHLRELTYEGAHQRYPRGIPTAARRQLDKELALIHELEYEGYFLTMHEIVRFCRQEQILCQGRGSAANSAVCYCLGITAVDPVRMGLLFERFISKERSEPPDIDLDVQNDRREEVIQHVYEKYGRTHAAMVANVVRYRSRSAVREVGKVLDLPEVEIDRLANLLSYDQPITPELLAGAGFDIQSSIHQHLLRLTVAIQDFPRHLSIHPGGFLLGHEPVHDLVPIENATMKHRTVIQWDKDDIENLELFKVDLLGLGILAVMDKALRLLREHQQLDLSMATIPSDDEATFKSIRAGDTVGVFQIESRAQMAMLPRLAPRTWYDIVIEISIVRPGPISGGMVHPYLRRRNGEEPVTYPHPCLEPILEKTLGIPLFQEQVMQLAMAAADYTAGEADQLRRDMAAWRLAGKLERHHDRLVTRMIAKGIEREFAERVFEQIRGFGEYGFPESHAASFALIAWATAWLKQHHPASFVCALLNAQPMGFYAPATLVDDARRHGVTLLPIDAQHSDWDCTLELRQPSDLADAARASSKPAGDRRFAVRMGLRYIHNFHLEQAQRLLEARAHGSFEDIEDLARRSQLERSTLSRLAEAGALGSLDGQRRNALWQARGFGHASKESLRLQDREKQITLPELDRFETIEWDYATGRHSVRGHPLLPLREELHRLGVPDARHLNRLLNGSRVQYIGMVISRQRPKTAGGVVFMTLEDETGFVNLVVWRQVFAQHAALAKTASVLGVRGKIQSESGVTHLVVDELFEPQLSLRPEKRNSRDFR